MNLFLLHVVAAVLPCGALPSIVRRGDQHAVLDHLGHTLENTAPAPAKQPLPSALVQPAVRQAEKLGYVVPVINALAAPSVPAVQAAVATPAAPSQPRTPETQAKILGFVVPGIATAPLAPRSASAATLPVRTVPTAPVPAADTQARKLGYIVRGPPVLGSPGAPSVAGERPGSSGETQANRLGYIVPSARVVQTARPGLSADTQALKLGYVVPGAPASAVVPSPAAGSGVSAPVEPAARVMQIARPGVPADAQALKLGYVVPGAPAKVAFPSPKNVTGMETVTDALPVDPATQAKKLGYVVAVIPKTALPAAAPSGPFQPNTAQTQARRLGYIVPHAPRAPARAPTWPATRDIPLPYASGRTVRMPPPSSHALPSKQRPPARRPGPQSPASPSTTKKPYFQAENKDFARNAVHKSVVINHTRTVITIVTKNVTQTNSSNVRDKMPWPYTSRRRVPIPMRIVTKEPVKIQTRVAKATANATRSKVPAVVSSTSAPPVTTTTKKRTSTTTRTTTRKVTTSALPKSSTSAARGSNSTLTPHAPHASAGKAPSKSPPPVARRWDAPSSPSPDAGKDAEWSNVSIGSGHHWSVPNFGFHRRRRGWNHTYPQFGMPSLFNHTFGVYNWTPSPPGPNPWEPAPTPSPSPSPASLPFGRPFSVGDV